MRRHRREQCLQMILHVVVRAIAEYRPPHRETLQHLRSTRAILRHDRRPDFLHVARETFAERVLHELLALAQAELHLVITQARLHHRELGRGGGDARIEERAGIIRHHALEIIGGEGDQFVQAHLFVIERIFEESAESNHNFMGVNVAFPHQRKEPRRALAKKSGLNRPKTRDFGQIPQKMGFNTPPRIRNDHPARRKATPKTRNDHPSHGKWLPKIRNGLPALRKAVPKMRNGQPRCRKWPPKNGKCHRNGPAGVLESGNGSEWSSPYTLNHRRVGSKQEVVRSRARPVWNSNRPCSVLGAEVL